MKKGIKHFWTGDSLPVYVIPESTISFLLDDFPRKETHPVPVASVDPPPRSPGKRRRRRGRPSRRRPPGYNSDVDGDGVDGGGGIILSKQETST